MLDTGCSMLNKEIKDPESSTQNRLRPVDLSVESMDATMANGSLFRGTLLARADFCNSAGGSVPPHISIRARVAVVRKADFSFLFPPGIDPCVLASLVRAPAGIERLADPKDAPDPDHS